MFKNYIHTCLGVFTHVGFKGTKYLLNFNVRCFAIYYNQPLVGSVLQVTGFSYFPAESGNRLPRTYHYLGSSKPHPTLPLRIRGGLRSRIWIGLLHFPDKRLIASKITQSKMFQLCRLLFRVSDHNYSLTVRGQTGNGANFCRARSGRVV